MSRRSKKVAYLAMPYRAKTIFGEVYNIYKARKLALWLWQKGYAVVCPHSNSAVFDRLGVSNDDILPGCISIMKKCDVLVLGENWQKSTGALAEYSEFVRYNGKKASVYEITKKDGVLVLVKRKL